MIRAYTERISIFYIFIPFLSLSLNVCVYKFDGTFLCVDLIYV